jgi:hypothetical protein
LDKSRWTVILAAAAFLTAGLFPMLDALGVFPGSAERMNAPRWVVFLAGGLFFACGLWLTMLGTVGTARARTFGIALGVLIMMGLALVANWVAFGGGDRNDCGGGFSTLSLGYSSGVAELECRAAFGYGALLLDLMLLRGASAWWENRDPGNCAARAVSTACGWGLGLLLLPLLLLALLFTKTRVVTAKLTEKMRKKKPVDPPAR